MISRQVEILNAVFTPMHADGSVNFDRIPALFEHFTETGSQGIFLNGTTGECMSLTTQERLRLVEAWMAAKVSSKSKSKLIVHVGTTNLLEAAEMAKHAEQSGADGVSMVAPFYFRPKSTEEIVSQCAYVAQAAPGIPFYYYNIPSLTGVNFPLTEILELAPKRIPNFAGLKNSFNDLVDYQHALHASQQKHTLYWGTDEVFMMLYAGGNRNYVGSTYNYMYPYYQRMLKAYLQGDTATVMTLQAEADAIYRVLTIHNGIIAGKEIMRLIGVDCGPVRIPLQKLDQAGKDAIFQKLKKTSFFESVVSKKDQIPI
ncbi:MAG: dihydrodipicolinate synthase family protein [Chryseolinea sp.]